MNFIILGDKFQRRMKSKGCVALFKVNNNKTIIHNQYKQIKKKFPLAQINYISGFEHKKLQTFVDKQIEAYKDLNIIQNTEYQLYNDIYSVCLSKNLLSNNCFILFGDTALKTNIFSKFDPNNGSQVFIDRSRIDGIGCIVNNNRIENISYELDNKLSNIYYLSSRDAQILSSMIESDEYKNFFIFELINKLIDNNVRFTPYYIG